MRATVAVAGKYGLEGATVRRIAEEAGVHNTLITHYFGSREALLAAAAEWVFEEQSRIVEISIDLALDPQTQAELVAEVAAAPMSQVFLYEMVLAPTRRPELQYGASRLYDGYVRATQRSLADHGFPSDEPLARAVFAAIDGLVLQQVSVASAEQVRAALTRLGDLLRAFAPAQQRSNARK